MTTRTLFPSLVCGLAVGLALSTASPAPRAEEPVSFDKTIRPIFESNCWTCHNASTKLAQLDLSSRDSALTGGEHGPVLVPGRSAGSKLYRLVAGLDKPAMPLDGTTLSMAATCG